MDPSDLKQIHSALLAQGAMLGGYEQALSSFQDCLKDLMYRQVVMMKTLMDKLVKHPQSSQDAMPNATAPSSPSNLPVHVPPSSIAPPERYSGSPAGCPSFLTQCFELQSATFFL